jgi:hypothetical protein
MTREEETEIRPLLRKPRRLKAPRPEPTVDFCQNDWFRRMKRAEEEDDTL